MPAAGRIYSLAVHAALRASLFNVSSVSLVAAGKMEQGLRCNVNDEFKKRLVDYFDPGELIELIGVPIENLIEIFSEEIEENIDDLTEIMNFGEAHE